MRMSVVPSLTPGAEQAARYGALELADISRKSALLERSFWRLQPITWVCAGSFSVLRKEDPFIDHMLVRRVVDAALARNLIDKEGVQYRIGREEFTGKEALVRHAIGGNELLVDRIIEDAIADGLLEVDGSALVLGDERFAGGDELRTEALSDDDVRNQLYRQWVGPKGDSLQVKLFISL